MLQAARKTRLDRPLFYQLTSEEVLTRFVRGYSLRYWFKPSGARNEALDCRVYALAALYARPVPLRGAVKSRAKRAAAAAARTGGGKSAAVEGEMSLSVMQGLRGRLSSRLRHRQPCRLILLHADPTRFRAHRLGFLLHAHGGKRYPVGIYCLRHASGPQVSH
jgi:hypothetical protein